MIQPPYCGRDQQATTIGWLLDVDDGEKDDGDDADNDCAGDDNDDNDLMMIQPT